MQQQFLIVERTSLERFEYDHAHQTLVKAALADRDQLQCLAKINITVKQAGGQWEYIASRELPASGIPGFAQDATHSWSRSGEILHISAHGTGTNVARVTDLKNGGALEGYGINSWLIGQAREAFMAVSGPDPWLEGSLSAVDHDNVRRLPFWRRHVDDPCTVDSKGNGHFLGPWLRGHNPYRQKHAVILLDQVGQPPTLTPQHGLTLDEINGRLICRMRKSVEPHSFWHRDTE